MKILHLVSCFPPDGLSGVGQVVSWLHSGLRARGHDSLVLTAGTSTGDPSVRRIARSPAGYLAALATQVAAVRRCDVVHCQHGDALPLLLAMRLARVRTPVLATFHVHHRAMAESFRPYRVAGETFATDAASWRYRHLVAHLHRCTDRLTRALASESSFISRFGAIEHLGPERGERAAVIYYAVPDREDDRDEPRATEILYVGSFGHRKRVFALPFLLREVRRSLPGVKLRLVGAARADQPRLAALFERLHLSGSVHWEGRLPPEAIHHHHRTAGVLVVPSAYEGLPMVILEAFSSGVPCVATKVAAHAEAIEDGCNGFLVPRDDVALMAARCVEILADREKGVRMGRCARETVRRRFTLDRQVAEYEALYENLCQRRR